MALLSNNEIENIRQNANIVDIISSYVPLTLKGKNYFGVCPFHEDHSPSMSVSPERQIYKCFSCGAAGNVFSFVKEYENVSFVESVKIVADKIGYNLNIKIDNKEKPHKQEYEIMSYSLKYFQNYLNTKEGSKARDYLKDRNISEELIEKFDIGLSPNNKDDLAKILTKKYDRKLLNDLSLINVDGANIYDSFIDRIIFPIHDLDGNVVAFTGRVYSSNSSNAKYFNSRESDIFKKGQLFYNYHRALPEIKKLKEVIIVEGNMDAIRMDSIGLSNTIALMGTSLTKNQIDILKKLRSKVILMLDNDEAGETATLANGQSLEKANIPCYVVRLSDYKDPDEYIINNGKDKIKNLIKEAKSFLEFQLYYYKQNKDLTKTSDLINYIKQIINSVSNIDDKLTKEITINKLSKEYDIPIDLLKEQLKDSKKEDKEEQVIEKKKASKYERVLKHIIYYLLNDPVYINKFDNSNIFISIKDYRNLIQEITYYYQKNKEISIAAFISYISSSKLYDLTIDIVNEIEEDLSDDNFEKYITNLTKISKEDKIKQLKKEMQETLDVNKKMELANTIIELKKEV